MTKEMTNISILSLKYGDCLIIFNRYMNIHFWDHIEKERFFMLFLLLVYKKMLFLIDTGVWSSNEIYIFWKKLSFTVKDKYSIQSILGFNCYFYSRYIALITEMHRIIMYSALQHIYLCWCKNQIILSFNMQPYIFFNTIFALR